MEEPLARVVGGHLADQHGADDGILVADIRPGEVAVAFLKAEDEAVDLTGGFETGDLVADPLEAGEYVAAFNAVMGSDRIGQRGRDDGLAHDRVLGHGALFDAARADVVEQQHADLVAGQQLIAAVLALDGDADAVGVGGRSRA